MVSSSRDSERKHVYLLHGFIGSGKTTFARILAREVVAMRLTHDEYMVLLYGTNPPEDLFRVYYDRVTEMIWKMTVELIQLNVPVILDFGFWTKESRLKAIERVHQIGAEPHLYAMECNPATMKDRCLKRNQLEGDTLLIDEPAFDKFFKFYEPISEDEKPVFIKTD